MSLHIVFLLFRIMIKKNMYIFCFLYVQMNQSTAREIKTVYTDRSIPFIMFTFPKQN